MARSNATYTFLFTDIEGSTRAWDASPGAMATALARHDAIVGAVISGAGGQIFKRVGDAFCAAFSDPQAAIETAIAIQLALAAEDWSACGRTTPSGPIPLSEDSAGFSPIRVRCALHTGTAEARDDDYFGPALNRTARLLACGHGGQVLLSGTTADLAADAIGEQDGLSSTGWALRDLGEHRLRDLSRPERVYQLLAPTLAVDFPPLGSLDQQRHNLPVQLTQFIGRESELAELQSHILAHRLVTVVGPGGTGKTRLALQAAAELLAGFPDGVWFVDLAMLEDNRVVAGTALAVLGQREQPGRSVEQSIIDHMKDRSALVILDNSEHVVDGCAAVSELLVRTCPRLHVLATSRQPLGVHGEQVVPLAPLKLPAGIWGREMALNAVPSPADIAALKTSEAVRLFLDRAALVVPGFQVDHRNAPAVAAIVRQLDGIPLALELAAARLRALPVEQIAARLDDRFRLLTGGARSLLPRQQTLRAAIDWSYDLLEPADRHLLARLAIFHGGWSLEAAEGVCADDPALGTSAPAAIILEDWQVLDGLSRLVDHSLVVVTRAGEGGPTRYNFLETIFAYARERLAASGELHELEVRRLLYFEALTAEVERHRNAPDDAAWLMRIDPEMANLRACLEAARDGQAPAEPAFEIAGRAIWYFASRWGYRREWADLIETLIERHSDSVSLPARARAAYALGSCERVIGTVERADIWKREALNLARQAGLRLLECWCLNDLGNQARSRGSYAEAETLLLDSLAIKAEIGSPWDLGISYNNLVYLAFAAGDFAAAYRWAEQAEAVNRQTESSGLLAGSLTMLAYFDLMDDRLALARARLAEAQTTALASGHLNRQLETWHVTALLDLMDSSPAWAIVDCTKALRCAEALNQIRTELLDFGSWLSTRLGNAELAARLAGVCHVTPPRTIDLGVHPHNRAMIDQDLAKAKLELGENAWNKAFDLGTATPPRLAQQELLAWLETREGNVTPAGPT